MDSDDDDPPLAEPAAAETEAVAEVPLTDDTTAKGFAVALYEAVELSCAEDHVEAVMVDEGAEVVEDDEGATQVDEEVGATQVDVDEGAAQVEVEVGRRSPRRGWCDPSGCAGLGPLRSRGGGGRLDRGGVSTESDPGFVISEAQLTLPLPSLNHQVIETVPASVPANSVRDLEPGRAIRNHT